MRKIILDVDTGHDDAVAIIMAGRNSAIDLLGITVTAGNQVLPKTLKNTLNLCSALSIDAPVFAGMTRPILCDLETASSIHGESGYDGPVFDSCTKVVEPQHAVLFIIETLISAKPHEITIVAVGPLTNIAMALRLSPSIVPKIREIVLMGGSSGAGNVTPSSEFNIHTDPEAASIVFSSGIPIVMMGLDVTTQVLLTEERFARLQKVPGKAASLFSASMEKYSEACKKYIGEVPAMHDPCCIAYILNPHLFSGELCHVDIELSGRYTRGRTVVDFTGITGRPSDVQVILRVNEEGFWDMLEAALQQYSDLA